MNWSYESKKTPLEIAKECQDRIAGTGEVKQKMSELCILTGFQDPSTVSVSPRPDIWGRTLRKIANKLTALQEEDQTRATILFVEILDNCAVIWRNKIMELVKSGAFSEQDKANITAFLMDSLPPAEALEWDGISVTCQAKYKRRIELMELKESKDAHSANPEELDKILKKIIDTEL